MLGRPARLVGLLIVLTLLASVAGCGGQQQSDVSEFSQIAQAADEALAQGYPPTISVQDVYNNIVVGGDDSYFLLSIRSPEHYEKGHVPGAVNIPYREVWKAENLAKIPKDKKIVVICYTGHTASQVTMLLKMLGYEAYAMKFGMMGWTDDPEILGIPSFNCAESLNYPLETGAVEAEGGNEFPTVSTGKESVDDMILAQAEAYLTSGRPPVISAADVYNNVVVGGDDSYFLLSIRKPEHFEKGHVPGAINIPFGDIAKEENLAKLPKDKKIIVICYTGHTASQATMLLNLLGYEAYAMKFGMMGWTSDPDVLGIPVFDCNPPNFPTE